MNKRVTPKAKVKLLIVILLFVIAGTIYMMASRAATPYIAAEPENGTVTSPATQLTDSTASGSSAVKFAAAGGSTGSCALPKYPTPVCTGVPAGTALTTVSGDLTISTAGTVVDSKHVTGSIIVKASNVTIKNSLIDGDVCSNNGCTGTYTIMDSTIGTTASCVVSPGLGDANYTALRVRIQGHDDGFRAGGPNVTIKDSYVKNCGQASSHGDGIQDYLAAQKLVFEHNTMDLCGPWTAVPTSASQCNVQGHNSPVFIHSDISRGNGSTDVTIRNNLAMGGVFTFYLYPAYGYWEISGNRVVNKTWDYGAYEMEGLCGNVDLWNDNRIVTIDANYNVLTTVSTEPC